MKPERSNYETWLIDWMDGKLSPGQIEILQSFLDDNPYIKQEFDALNMVKLFPQNNSFLLIEKLKKSTSELTQAQFEYLATAAMENDLSPEQIFELNDIITGDASRKKLYDLIRKTKLIPPVFGFPNKDRLRKVTPGQRITRLAVTGLSVAATVGLLILAYLFIPGNIPERNSRIVQNVTNDTILLKSSAVLFQKEVVSPENIITPTSELNYIKTGKSESGPVTLSDASLITYHSDSTVNIRNIEEFNISRIVISNNIRLFNGISEDVLIAHQPVIIAPLIYDDERSNVQRFVAKFFHEKIMKDTIAVDRPIKAYEIAEAGVTGLNKLLGWEMAFYRNTDDNGELKSIYFSSKILKFNAPVKKTSRAL